MIFISAQPDENYFLWQLEIQIINFRKISIARERIHILIGYNRKCGISKRAREFYAAEKDNAMIFFYPDTRKENCYLSSLRPNLLKKHWKKYQYLDNENIFYHDSDILFTGNIEKIESLAEDDVCYLSPTESYFGINHIVKNCATN